MGRRGADKNSRAAVLDRIGIRAALYSSSRSPLGLWRSICRVPTANAESMDCVVASLCAMTILVIPCKYWHSRRQIFESYRYPCRPLFVIAKPFRAVAIHLQSANRKCGINGLRCRFAPRNDDSCYPVQVLALPPTNLRIAVVTSPLFANSNIASIFSVFYSFRLFSIALIAAGNCPNAVISASARVPQYSCSP